MNQRRSPQPGDRGRYPIEMKYPIQWTFSDGWIMASIHIWGDERWSTLADIVAAADAMNHAIPTSGELTLALTRLHSHNVIERSRDGFRVCEPYRESFTSALQGRGSLFETPNKAKRWLAKTELCVYQPVVVEISPHALTAACQVYKTSLKATKFG